MDPSPSRLLNSPREIRDQILETLFFSAQLSTVCKEHRPNPFQRANYGILATNKQLHREASKILFHGAVLRLDITQEATEYLPSLMTKTVIPVWSSQVRDRYHDKGTRLDFLRSWQGLKRVRHVEMSLLSQNKREGVPIVTVEEQWLYLKVCGIAVDFLNGLPDVESLTIYTDGDGYPWMEKCKKELRALKSAKLLVLGTGDSCGHRPCAHIVTLKHGDPGREA